MEEIEVSDSNHKIGILFDPETTSVYLSRILNQGEGNQKRRSIGQITFDKSTRESMLKALKSWLKANGVNRGLIEKCLEQLKEHEVGIS